MKKIMMIAGVVLLTSSAWAGQKSYEGSGFEGWIDNGGPENPNLSEIFVSDHGEILSMDIVSLIDFNHTWAGDLIIRLTHKDTGTSVTLLDRPGIPESNFGANADFAGNYDWQDGGFVWDDMTFDGGVVPTNVIFGPVTGALSDFAGEDKFGTWSLTISDGAFLDVGSLGGWGFTVTNVPAPGALALLGLAGLVARRKRTRA
ncbi:MAG: proprotein convertase P-domain-containing protein [Planctomycetes bacterium]|nr:proprotein convertase P-domain-containing protein [Planctomycetota bacterium]